MTRNAAESRPLAPLRHAVGIGAHVQRNTGSQNPLISMGRVLSSDHAACTVTVRPGPPTRRVWPCFAWDFDAASQLS
jgi:hypothetical protein